VYPWDYFGGAVRVEGTLIVNGTDVIALIPLVEMNVAANV
jgi:hypothetical protein